MTSKVAQQRLALDTLARMLPARSGAFAVQITARDRICPVDRLGCLPGRCPLMRGFAGRLEESGIAHELGDLGVADGDAIASRALAPRGATC